MGCDIVTVSTDTPHVHLAWQRDEKDLANVKYTMASDRTGRISRLKWKDEGDKTLVNPGAKMVGKVHEAHSE